MMENAIKKAIAERDARIRRDERRYIGRLIREAVESVPEPRPNPEAAEALLRFAEALEQ